MTETKPPKEPEMSETKQSHQNKQNLLHKFIQASQSAIKASQSAS